MSVEMAELVQGSPEPMNRFTIEKHHILDMYLIET
jgi:hypothetical protein